MNIYVPGATIFQKYIYNISFVEDKAEKTMKTLSSIHLMLRLHEQVLLNLIGENMRFFLFSLVLFCAHCSPRFPQTPALSLQPDKVFHCCSPSTTGLMFCVLLITCECLLQCCMSFMLAETYSLFQSQIKS